MYGNENVFDDCREELFLNQCYLRNSPKTISRIIQIEKIIGFQFVWASWNHLFLSSAFATCVNADGTEYLVQFSK
jgi:hypothetical protein